MISHSYPHASAQSANEPRSQRPPVATEATLAEVLRDLKIGLDGLSAEQARERLMKRLATSERVARRVAERREQRQLAPV